MYCLEADYFNDNFYQRVNRELNDPPSCAIVIGAGSSKGAIEDLFMPGWGELLEKMLVGAEIKGMKADASHYLEIAGVIENRVYHKMTDKWERYYHQNGTYISKDAIEVLAEKSTIERMARYVNSILKSDIPKGIKTKSDATLDVLADACISRFKRNKRTIVISYNYENIFEYILRWKVREKEKKNEDNIKESDIHVHSYTAMHADLRGAVNELINSSQPEIDILYVHGRIPFLEPENISCENGIILSQQSYDKLSRSALAFTNQLQYVIYSALPTLAIGFSGDDPNFRRLRTDLRLANYSLPPFYLMKFCSKATCPCGDESRKNEVSAAACIADFHTMISIPASEGNYTRILKCILTQT